MNRAINAADSGPKHCEHNDKHPISTTGQKTSLLQQITQEFRSFYSSLYNLHETAPAHDITTEYLDQSLMPSLPAEAQELLEEPITLPKLQLALNSAKPGKAPGPDGLTVP